MFSNGYVLILLIILKCTSFSKLLLADNSTNNINNTNFNVNSDFNSHLTGSVKLDSRSRTVSMSKSTTKKPSIVKSNSNSVKRDDDNATVLNDLFASITESSEDDRLEPRVEPLLSTSKFSSNGKRGRQQDRLQQPPTGLPVFPERPDAVYFIVAVAGGAKTWGRTLARTLLDMGPPFGSSMGPPLRPLYVEIPPNGRFSVKVLTSLCQQSERVPLAGVVVIGDGQSARAIVLSGNAMKMPVLWAKGGTANIHGIQREGQALFQSLLQPSAREILEAIRALFLQTHWHSFFVLSDVGSTIVLASNEGRPLKEPPLVPTILPLPARNGDVFRQLAQISRSTRGIVLLLCDVNAAQKIMTEAKRLNMDGGHFIWLWADTSSTTEFFDLHSTPMTFDEGVVEYPEAMKQMTPQNSPNGNSRREDANNFREHLEDLVERKVDYESLDVGRRHSESVGGKSKSRQQKHGMQRQREQQVLGEQQLMQSFLKEVTGAGRYIFGLNRNDDESAEVKNVKNKRNVRSPHEQVNEVLKNSQGKSKTAASVNVDMPAIEDGQRIDSHFSAWVSDPTENNQEFNGDYRDYIDPNSIDSSKDIENESRTKLKRTSSHFGRNITKSSHVLFHHFKDFPVGFLALRPVKMPIDRHFIRSAIRLFASTWARVDRGSNSEEDNINRTRYRNRDSNHFYTDMDPHEQQPVMRSLQRYRRRRSGFMRTRRRRRYAQTSKHNIEIVNTGLKHSSSSVIRDLNNKNTEHFNITPLTSVDKQISDFNGNLLIKNNRINNTSSYNQNLSGLTHSHAVVVSNDRNEKGSNTTSSSRILVNFNSNVTESIPNPILQPVKPKRFNTWWSAKDTRQQQPTATTSGTQDSFERYRKGSPHYKGGCYGMPSALDLKKAETFSKALREATILALSGRQLLDGSVEKSLTTNFELLNLVPDDALKKGKLYGVDVPAPHIRLHKSRLSETGATKWRHVGSISGTNVQLDTIVWPGGDIVVSGLSVQSKTIFRIVTALAPPFVMQSELDEDGLCLRGLPCHRLSPSAPHNLTLMFNAIETRDRLEEDAIEHGMKSPPHQETSSYDHSMYMTKCCYGLTMDLLENIAMELNFEFHLYVVHDELFGTRRNSYSKYFRFKDGGSKRTEQSYWNEKHEQHFIKEQMTNRRSQQAPLGGSNYYSASFERKSTLNPNLDWNENEGGTNTATSIGDFESIRQSYITPSKSPDTSKDEGEEDTGRQSNQEKKNVDWNGIIGDLLSGSADMSFAPLSVTKARAEAIDFSVPYFHSGVSLLAAPTTKSEIPLLAFLLPFSPELWIAIFTSLNVTAIAVAIYEWLSPFGLNPWGRQRSKNFSMSSALWVMWGLLCGHLVAFKAPKSWPNKFLINVWGGFSVIFIASYTANIAALIAGLFFHNASNRYDVSLLTQRVGAPTASAAESYIQKNDHHLWEHMKKYTLQSIDDGIRGLKNGSLDLIMGDTPILDYYRATDHGCNLQRIGDNFVEDTYAIGMTKGFPLKDSISALIAKYSSNGYLDILTEKWYGGLPCFKLDNDIVQPRPLGVEAVAGVFLLLGLGMILGLLILIFEHLFYKYTLPILRHKPKGTVWKSRNIMFFSQKLYRFINCVELVSPHHAARELVHTLRQGQIASLFQKSIKRKEDEQRRRRKSKAQFFEMIQEIRRVQQQEKNNPKLEVVAEADAAAEAGSETHAKPKSSPKPRLFAHRKDARSRSNSSTLNVRRFSTDSILSERMDTIGRRLSRDLTNSPPDFGRRFETFGKHNKFDTISSVKNLSNEKIEETKFDTYNGRDSNRPPLPVKKYQIRRTPINADTFSNQDIAGNKDYLKVSPLPEIKESLVHPICQEDSSKALLRDQLHKELRSKCSDAKKIVKAISIQTTDESKENPLKHRRQKSSDGLENRPRMPSPHHSSNGVAMLQPPALPPKVSSRTNLTQLSLDRLSREDLLKLSESSQSEIHEYLNQAKSGCPNEPP